MLRSVADVPTMLAKTFFGKEMVIRAVGAPSVELLQPFLPEGTRSAAVAIVVEVPRDIVIPGRRRMRVRAGLEVAFSEDCSLEVRPIDEEKKPTEI